MSDSDPAASSITDLSWEVVISGTIAAWGVVLSGNLLLGGCCRDDNNLLLILFKKCICYPGILSPAGALGSNDTFGSRRNITTGPCK